ncbi:hypothetical protein, partial [Xanthomonas euvesicatoria]|uniref:hypothetical protein n=1 Tax=Xanthomonas euvesicatoria TaxID=456327 RepID=UPI001C47A568
PTSGKHRYHQPRTLNAAATQGGGTSRLAQLAPDLIEAIALGRLEVGVSQLLRGKLSASWLAQREALVAGSR